MIDRGKLKSFLIHIFSAHTPNEGNDSGLNSWDLAVLRYPLHPQHTRIETRKGVNHLTLDFHSVPSKFSISQQRSEKGLDNKRREGRIRQSTPAALRD